MPRAAAGHRRRRGARRLNLPYISATSPLYLRHISPASLCREVRAYACWAFSYPNPNPNPNPIRIPNPIPNPNQVRADACWAFSYLADCGNAVIDALARAGAAPGLVQVRVRVRVRVRLGLGLGSG